MRYFIGLLLYLFVGGLQAQTASVLTVSTVSPSRQLVEDSISAIGYIEPRETALVNARLNGETLKTIEVALGERVEKGQRLALFDDAGIRTDIAVAKAQVLQAETALKQAKKNVARARGLLKSHAVSQIEAERQTDAAETAKAGLSIAKARLEAQLLRLAYTTVKAPVSGIITEKQALTGATVAVGTPLFSIMAEGIPAWQAQVPTTEIAAIHHNSVAEVTLPDATTVTGRVYNIAPTVDRQSREITVYVALPAQANLRAGMLLSGVFHLGQSEQMLIPADTVQSGDGHYYVWLVDENDTVHQQQIKLGRHIGAMVEVRSGLQDDSRIVARGGAFLVEGNKVRVVSLPGAAS